VPITLPAPASQTTDAIFTGTITGGEMRGTVQVVGRGPGTFTATRAGGAPPTGGTGSAPVAQPSTPAGTRPPQQQPPPAAGRPGEGEPRPRPSPTPPPGQGTTPPADEKDLTASN
jgi:hypothetical protein